MQSNYNNLTFLELKSIAKEKQLKNISKLRKGELINVLINHDSTIRSEEQQKTDYYTFLSKKQLIEELSKRNLQWKNGWNKSRLVAILVNDDMKESKVDNIECCVCYEDMPSNMITKCNHAVCKTCVEQLRKNECPMCRAKLESPYGSPLNTDNSNHANGRPNIYSASARNVRMLPVEVLQLLGMLADYADDDADNYEYTSMNGMHIIYIR